jgi:DNA-binding CsgD family transcriptional regulator
LVDQMTGVIVGRERELADLDEFLDTVPAGPATLVIEGEPGIGKTTIWQAGVAGARERSWRVLESRPVESEAKLSYAALGDLLEAELEATLPSLPGPQRRALSIALLQEEPRGPRPEERAIAVGVLGALRRLSEAGPVVLAVDDVQWLDTASASVLDFALRRLRDERVGVLLAWRVEGPGALPLGLERGLSVGLRRMRAGPLSVSAIHKVVLAGLGVAFDRPILRRIHETSGGNPFFALELARALQRQRGRIEPADGLPVPDELHALVGARLAGLPERTREALLVAAALSQPSLPLLEAVIAEDPVRQLAPARKARVVWLEGETVRFAHPLLASAAYSQAPLTQRREVHRRLAALVRDGEERARHLALSTEGPDEEVALSLEEAARSAFLRGATHAAVELSERARARTPEDRPEELRRRSMAEAEYRIQAADSAGARDLLENVLETCPSGTVRAEVLSRLGDASYFGLDWRSAATVFRQALDEPGGTAAARARSELGLSLALGLLQEPAPEIVAHARAAVDLAEHLDDPALFGMALANEAYSEILLGHGFRTDLIERACTLERWMHGVPVMMRPHGYLAVMLAWVDDLPGAVGECETVVRQAREHGDELSLAWVLGRMGQVECLAGAWREALAHIEEGEEVLLQAGQPTNRAFLLAVRALVEAHVGQVSSTREAGMEALQLATALDAPLVRTIAACALGFLELSLGRPGEADRHLAPLVAATRESGVQEPGRDMRFVPDEIEALIGLGRCEEAEELLEWFEGRGVALDRPSARAAAARCRGLLAAAAGDLEGAASSFGEALVQHERVPMPFERARTLLALGSARRRARERRAARECLEQALAIFEQLGAAIWAQRARAELARIAGRAPSPGQLTTAEQRVAELVAEGRTNKEVAAELVLTVRAVESTLTKVYAKLGVRSRTELTSRLGTSRASELS